jgi:MAE_28990/MAE_18760-like HEPN
MTKIRTVSQLSDQLSEELAWRKKELIYIKTLIEKNRYRTVQSTLLRSGTAILYAHWEGFVKNAATSYVEFVARQNLKYSELAPNFLALAVKKQLNEAQGSYRAVIFTKVVDFLITGLESKCLIQWDDAIKTQSNLNSEVLKDIICILGLDYSLYETKEKIIDETLLRSRNEIAHGQYLLIEFNQYIELHHEIISLMDLFRDQIENAAIAKTYLCM